MRILCTNDDGIHADGLAALERIAEQLSDDVWVCAPEYEQSGASRALTLAEPIRVRALDERRFATTGTPTDCVMLGVHELVKVKLNDNTFEDEAGVVAALTAKVDGLIHVWTIGHTLLLFRPSRERATRYPLP